MRASNAEWDFMGRSFLVWSLANMSLREPQRRQTYLETIDRIIDAFPADEQPQVRVMLADSLKAVVAQQLLKTADGKGRCAANEVLVSDVAR